MCSNVSPFDADNLDIKNFKPPFHPAHIWPRVRSCLPSTLLAFMASAPIQIDVSPLLGPAFVGILLNWCLLGIVMTQVQSYYASYHRTDKWFTKSLVYGMLLVELFFTIGLTHGAFALTVTSWGNPLALVNLPWTVSLMTPSAAISSLSVQCFFAWRLWKLTREIVLARVMTVVIFLLSLLQFSGAFAFTILFAVDYNNFLPFARDVQSLIISANLWLIGSFITDLLIALMMVWVLRRTQKQFNRFKATDDIVTRLIISSVATGGITTIVALVDIFLYMLPSMRNNNYHVACAMIMGKLYTIMLLANLNGRKFFGGSTEPSSIRLGRREGSSIGDFEMQTSASSGGRSGRRQEQTTEVVVTKSVEFDTHSYATNHSTKHHLSA